MPYESLIFRTHAIRRMFERGITTEAVKVALANGEMIQEYPEDTPYPSYLLIGHYQGRPLHIIAADNSSEKATIVITVYEPDSILWTDGFKKRRKR